MQCLNLRLTRDNLSRSWGFRLQGGFDTGYPLSVQRVFSGSPAEGVLQRGDVIKIIDSCEAQNMDSKEIQDIVRTSGRQLNFVIERDGNKENFQNPLNNNEPKVSVKATRKKFITTDNDIPKPFGEFGTHYDKKDNSLPTAMKIDMNTDYHFDQNRNHNNQTEEEDEKIDYSFMTLPVNERKKLFATPNESNVSKTMPRQRSYSFRPQQKSYEVVNRHTNYIPQNKTPQYGWGPSNEKLINARQIASATLKPQIDRSSTFQRLSPQPDKYATIAFPQYLEPNRRYSSSTQIYQSRPNQTDSAYTFGCNTPNLTKKVSTHIYRCGPNQDPGSSEPAVATITRGVSNTKPLYVKTYPVQSFTPTESPRMFRPAYPAFSNEPNCGDNWSTISMRSEPYSRFHERNLAIDRSGVYRLSQEPVASVRSINNQMSSLQIGEPRTRIIANATSPSHQLNKSFWNSENAPRITYEQPTHHYYVKANPSTHNAPRIRREITVPKSNSNITINQIRQTNEDVYSQVAWLKQHRGSFEGASDF